MVWEVCLFHTCTLSADDPNLVQLGNYAPWYTILYGLMGQCYMLLPYPGGFACALVLH